MEAWGLVLLPLLAVPIVLLFRFVGCGSFGVNPYFTITVEPASVTGAQGGTASATVTVNSHHGYGSAVTLTTDVQPDVFAQFAPNPATPPLDATIQSTLTLAVASAATVGPRTITVRGGDGGGTRTATVTLTVNAAPPPVPPPPTPDFTLSLTPAAASVARGQTLTLTVNINRTGGFAGAVTLTANPAGGFTPNPAAGNTSTFSVNVPANQPTGPQTLTVTGVSGSLSRATTATITVTP